MPAAKPQPIAIDLRSFIVATAGHVDHGKTSLVRALTGVDTDTLREEKDRGLTINLGFAYSQERITDEGQFCTLGFIDVPGHRDFIHNMLAGVGSVHAALLVIAADDGIMPQTREHLSILNLLGVDQAVIAVSKCDNCDQARLQQLRDEIRDLLADTTLVNAVVIPTSSKTGQGVDQLKSQLLELARSGNSIDTANRHFRFQIDRSFTVKGIGTVVTGTALAGDGEREHSYAHSSSQKEFRVRALRLHDSDIDRVSSGERAALNLAAANLTELQRGDWLHDPWLTHPVNRFDVSMRWLAMQPPTSGTQYHLHIGAAHYLVSLRALTEDPQRWFQIRSELPLSIHYGDRFIVRDPTGTQTLGGGHVVDIFVPRRHRASPQRLAVLEALDQSDESAFAALLDLSESGVDLHQFRLSRNLTDEGMEEILDKTRDAGSQLLILDTKSDRRVAFSRKQFEILSKRLLHLVRIFHEQHPGLTGVAEPQISKELSFAGSFPLLQAVVDKLTTLQLLTRSGNLYHLPSHSARISAEEQFFTTTIHPLLKEAGKIPPRTRELAEATGTTLAKLESILKIAARNGQVIRVADNRYFLPETILELADFTERLAAGDSDDGGFSVIQFRDASGIGRNLCIEILEYFDNRGFTRRDGNTRYLRTDKKNLFS